MPFEDCICLKLTLALQKVAKAYRDELSELNLTQGQFFLLVAIMEKDGLLPSELANKTCQDRATVTGLLGRLEKDGWVARKTDPSDRRTIPIFLTPHGLLQKTIVLELFEQTNRKFLSRFTQDEWHRFQSSLTASRSGELTWLHLQLLEFVIFFACRLCRKSF